MTIFKKKDQYPAAAGAPSSGNGGPWQSDEAYMRTCAKLTEARGLVALLEVAVREAEGKELEAAVDYEMKKPHMDAELISEEEFGAVQRAYETAKATSARLREQVKKAQERLPELQRARELSAAEAQRRDFPRSARLVIEGCNRVEEAIRTLKTTQEELAQSVKQHRTLGDRGALPSTFSGFVVHPAHFEKVYAQGMVAIGLEELRKVVSRLEKKLGAQG